MTDQPPNPRQVGPLGALAVVAGSMLGVGVLLAPPVVATNVPSLAGFVGLWVLGAVVAAAGGLVYAELATMYPEAGGDVVFLERAFGRGVAAVVGCVVFIGGFAGSTAAMAVALGTYQLQTLLASVSAIDLGTPLIGSIQGDQLVGAGLVVLLTATNAAGARVSAQLQTALTVVPLLGLGLLAGWGILVGSGDLRPTAQAAGGLGTAWLSVYFAYSGWPAIVYLAGEVRDPGRTLPIAVLGGTALIAVFYGVLCAAFLFVLGFDGLAGAGEAGTALAAALLGERGALVAAAFVAVSVLGTINATLLGGSRVMWALARAWNVDVLTRRDRRGTPIRLLLLQALISAGLCTLGGFETLMSVTTLAMLAAGALTVAAQVVLRRREPNRPRPFRAPLHPLPAVVYILSTIVVFGLVWAG